MSKPTRLGTLGLALAVLGTSLTGCQATTSPGETLAPTSQSPDRPVSDRTEPVDEHTAPDSDDLRAEVRGRVRTPTGAALINAVVQVRSLDTPPVPVPDLVVTTDEDGYFLWRLAPGRYEFSVVPPDGGGPVTAPAIDVRAGARRTIDITVN